MTGLNEQKFYNALSDLFIGAKIEGDSGYVNLMKIKSNYYKLVLKKFKQQVDNDEIFQDDFKEEFFDKLYDFFHRYFSESGSVYFVKTSAYQKVYEKVYSDNKDVVLFWKTHMLYYVKSDILFQSIDIEVENEYGAKFNFFFDVEELKAKQNNEKKELVFKFKEIKKECEDDKNEKQIIVLSVSYSEKGSKTKKDEILKAIRKENRLIKEDILDKAIKTFKKQSEVDFFINKNAKAFLEEQLDLYLHQLLLTEENKFTQKRLDQIKAIKTYAKKIISFISQFEDELVKIWNKPKFALNSNYVITLDKLSDEIIEKISNHPNLQKQIDEWVELGIVEDEFDFVNRDKEKYKYLPIDTKYFKDLEIRILDLFENIDKALDGRLIQSENYQALNTLKNKYKGRVDLIYIDPPYNAPSSEIVYVNNYKHSSWLTLMENRISLAKSLLKQNGIFKCATDDNEKDRLTNIFFDIFGEENYISTLCVIQNPGGRSDDKFIATTHEYCLLFANDKSKLMLNNLKKENYTGKINLNPFRRGGANSTIDKRPNLHYPIYYSIEENKISVFKENDKMIEILPIDTNGIKRVWRWGKKRVEENIDKLIVRNINGRYDIFVKEDEKEFVKPKSLWNKSNYAGSTGTLTIKNFGLKFDFPKSPFLLYDLFSLIANNNFLVLDYFAGSGTTAEAIIRLNKDDKGNRKFILIEMGEHFNSVILPRLKKLCVSLNYKQGKPQDRDGNSLFFKYYSLEQYENTLKKMRYSDFKGNSLFSEDKKVFEEYIFFGDEKLALSEVISENKDEVLEIDFDKLYPNIDWAETLSNLFGLPIKKIKKDSVILQDKDEEKEIKFDFSKMSEDEKIEFLQTIKPLIWWGE